ncbi:MAG: DNA polymerase III subunit delta [Candidatus Peregrinibacteria bacterium]|nr:DNA polymerase III subunit delta [Candidatus Peregrinibacteria bacterium]
MAITQLFFLTGENAFQLREEKQRWLQQFTEKHGSENLQRLDTASLTLRTLLDEVATMPFIAEKRLIVIEGMPKFTKEEFALVIGSVHPACVLLFVDGEPDKRSTVYKELLKTAKVTTFAPLKGRSLLQWLVPFVTLQGGRAEVGALESLIAIVGEDQETLAQEATKLCTYAAGRTITTVDVERIAVPSGTQIIWHLTDLLSAGKGREALSYARTLLERGEDPYSLWNVLLWMLRNLITAGGLAVDGKADVRNIASFARMRPDMARALASLVQRVDRATLTAFVERTIADEIALKTGGIRATDEAPEELTAVIDRFIIGCAGLVTPHV